MAKEILLYNVISRGLGTAENFINSLEENKDQDVVIRSNTPGGDVFAGWGMIGKMREHNKNILLKIEGNTSSMGTVMIPFSDRSEALEVTQIMIHRASGPVENEQDQKLLDTINKDLRRALESKIDLDKFEKVTGVTMDDVFDPEKRIEVWLTAAEAKEVGLIDKVNKIIDEKEGMKAVADKFAAFNSFNPEATLEDPEKKAKNPEAKIVDGNNNLNNENPKNMTLDKFKAENPDLFASVLALGVKAEKDRTGSWLAFGDVDFETVKKGIESGEELSRTITAEFIRKEFSAEALVNLKDDSTAKVETPEVKATKEETEASEKEVKLNAFEAKLNESLGLAK